jgi:tetratricopeptide (TPR) repeat protein
VPLLIVCTARPELLERRTGWGGGKANATTLSLRPLSDEDTSRLVAANLERPVLEAATQAALLERAGGNPLFAEQYARMLLEQRSGDELEVPDSVQAIVAARLDGLAVEDKELLHDAAVHGKVFWAGAVAAMVGDDTTAVDERLHALERKEFVRRQRRSAVAGEVEYAFRHMVLRDVAYGQIPRAARAEKHRLAAEWIDSLTADRDDHVELLADHYARALELTRAVGGDESLVAERARVAFRDAGDRAFALHAVPAAVRFYQQALELWPEGDPELPELLFSAGRAEVILERAAGQLIERARDALLASGDVERAAEAEMLFAMGSQWGNNAQLALELSAHAVAALEDEPPSEAKTFVLANRARLLAVVVWNDEDNHRAAIVTGRQALAMARALGLEELAANALHTIGEARVDLGDFEGIEEMEQSTNWLVEHGSVLEVNRSLNNLSVSYETVGRLEEGLETRRRHLESSIRLGLRSDVRSARATLAFFCFVSGRWDEAERLLDEALADDWPAGDVMGAVALYVLALLRFSCSETDAAGVDSARALEATRAMGGLTPDDETDRLWLAFCLSLSARVASARRRPAEADALTAELVRILPEALLYFPGAEILELFCAVHELDLPRAILLDAAAARPDRVWLQPMATAARGEFIDAAEELERLGTKPYAAYMRLRAAEEMVAEGRRAEADEQLAQALAFYRSVGAARYTREAEALLAATA